jgi:hypothetical protein
MFAPEFRNRLDAIITFTHLSPEIIAMVVEKFVLQLEAGGSNDGHTLTSGTFGTVPRRGGVSSPRGLRFRGSRPILNLACGDPADHDGGPITSAGRFSPLGPRGIN